MLSNSKLSYHWIPTHDQGPYLAMQARIGSRTPKLVSSGRVNVQHFADFYERNPGALLYILRDHALSEQKHNVVRDERAEDPAGTGRRHAQEWAQQLDLVYEEARQAGLALPDRSVVATEGLNEPPVWAAPGPEPWIEYEIARFDEQTRLGIPGVFCNNAIGHPGNGGVRDAPPNWAPWAPILRRIADNRAGHVLGHHVYFGQQGPAFLGRWLAYSYRDIKATTGITVPIVLTEVGAVYLVLNERGDPVMDAQRGWESLPSPSGSGNMTPAEYMAMLIEFDGEIRRDPNVLGATIFTGDGGHPWIDSFDVIRLADLWAEYAATVPPVEPPRPQQPSGYLPIVSGPGGTPTAAPEQPQPTTPAPVLYQPFLGAYPVTQAFGENPQWYSPLAGHPGIDYGTPAGTPILAPAAGVIAEADDWPQSWGKYIKIAAPFGEILLAHLDEIHVRIGQAVIAGQPIGLSGNSGRVIRPDGTPGPAPNRTWGAHLHLGIRLAPIARGGAFDGWADPAPYIEERPAPVPPPPPTAGEVDSWRLSMEARIGAIEAAIWPERIAR